MLLALPGWFREEFGPEMAVVFRDSLRDARREGVGAAAALGVRTAREGLALAVRLGESCYN